MCPPCLRTPVHYVSGLYRTRGDFRGVLVDRNLSVATPSQKTDSPSPTFIEDEHDDKDDFKGDLQ